MCYFASIFGTEIYISARQVHKFLPCIITVMFTVEIYLEVNIITGLSGAGGRHIFNRCLGCYWLPVQINYHYIAITSLG